jgi:hypothetical protein
MSVSARAKVVADGTERTQEALRMLASDNHWKLHVLADGRGNATAR